jgi:hypothetical protein
MFARVNRRQCHLVMRHDRRHNADEIDIVASHDAAPIIFDVWDTEFARDLFRMFTMRAGDRNDFGSFAILEAGNLRSAREPRANNTYANFFSDDDDLESRLTVCCRLPSASCLWCPRRDSNPEPTDYESAALTVELQGHTPRKNACVFYRCGDGTGSDERFFQPAITWKILSDVVSRLVSSAVD